MDEKLELDLLNLEFRLMLLDEGIKEAKTSLDKLAVDVETILTKYVPYDSEGYWTAE